VQIVLTIDNLVKMIIVIFSQRLIWYFWHCPHKGMPA